jgi:DNA-directed RNA polymerase subunit beta
VDKATGIVMDEVEYMTADVEDENVDAQANSRSTNSAARKDQVNTRYKDEFIEVRTSRVDYMDVSPRWSSPSQTSMSVPENDDPTSP